MPRVCRAMLADEDKLPRVGSNGASLGVRLPPDKNADVDCDQSGQVLLNQKGMSVSPRWRDLPPFRIPQRLKGKSPGARGSDASFCYSYGTGPFQNNKFADGLQLIPDRPNHGVVVPLRLVKFQQYEEDLAATRPEWVIDEN